MSLIPTDLPQRMLMVPGQCTIYVGALAVVSNAPPLAAVTDPPCAQVTVRMSLNKIEPLPLLVLCTVILFVCHTNTTAARGGPYSFRWFNVEMLAVWAHAVGSGGL